MPYADSVHRHDFRDVAQGVFDVVESDEQWKRHAATLDFRHRDTAIPPCLIALFHDRDAGVVLIDGECLRIDDVMERAHSHRRLRRAAEALLVHIAGILDADFRLVHVQHRT